MSDLSDFKRMVHFPKIDELESENAGLEIMAGEMKDALDRERSTARGLLEALRQVKNHRDELLDEARNFDRLNDELIKALEQLEPWLRANAGISVLRICTDALKKAKGEAQP
jgi:uncharacterized protein with von Willebrand factor type A (vWA) domain